MQVVGLVWLIGVGCRLLGAVTPVTVLAQVAGVVVTLTAVFTSGGWAGLIPNRPGGRRGERAAHRRLGPDPAQLAAGAVDTRSSSFLIAIASG